MAVETVISKPLKVYIEGRSNTTTLEMCRKQNILGETIENTSVYLFPFIIEFSIIGAHILYNMWTNVGKGPKFEVIERKPRKRSNSLKEQKLDWTGSDLGLFAGLFALVSLVITMLLYFSMVSQHQYKRIAVLVINITDTSITASMCCAIMIGFYQARNLKIIQNKSDNDLLLSISSLGLFLYSCFTIFAGSLTTENHVASGLLVLDGILELMQAGSFFLI